MPTRFRRRFLLRGEILEDSATLESPMDLNLVFVPLADVSQTQADDLVAAAERGSVAEVESMLQSYAGQECPLAAGGRCQQRGGRRRRAHQL